MSTSHPKHLVCPVCKAVDPPTTEDIDGRTVHAGCPGDHVAWTLFPAVRGEDDAETSAALTDELRAMAPGQVAESEAMLDARRSG